MEEDGDGEGEERKAATRWGVNRMDGSEREEEVEAVR
jgi:hypothetical protein